MKKENKNPKNPIYKRSLPCKLTPEEKMQRVEQFAIESERMAQVEIEHRRAKQEFKDKILEHGHAINGLSAAIRSGQELRPVDCEEVPDYQRGMWDLLRLDTGEFVESRGMSDAERQRDIRELEGSIDGKVAS
jgi:hypothetical protein